MRTSCLMAFVYRISVWPGDPEGARRDLEASRALGWELLEASETSEPSDDRCPTIVHSWQAWVDDADDSPPPEIESPFTVRAGLVALAAKILFAG